VLARTLASRAAGHSGANELERALERLCQAQKPLLLAFSGEEPLDEELRRQGRLERLARWPNLELTSLPGRDHTLRPIEAQRHALTLLDQALERALAPRRRDPERGPRSSGVPAGADGAAADLHSPGAVGQP
jgi:hypothetical protein